MKWSDEYEDQMTHEPKPRKSKKASEPIKLVEDYDYTVDLGLAAFILAIVAVIFMLWWNAPVWDQPPKTEAEITEPIEGPGKTWKEPGSARDTFNENFGR